MRNADDRLAKNPKYMPIAGKSAAVPSAKVLPRMARAKAALRKAAAKTGVDYATVREIALAMPNVADASTLRGVAFKVGGKLLACKAIHRSAEAESLMVRVDSINRDRLIAEQPQVYYLTEHYRVYSVVLVRLQAINCNALQSLFTIAWQLVTAAPAGARKAGKRDKATSVFR